MFTVASGGTMRVPRNLVVIATMNPWDKGVDELDVALESVLHRSKCHPARISSAHF